MTALNFQDSNSSTGFWHIRKFYNRNIANDWHKKAELKSQITESIDGKLHPKWCSSLYQILQISILKTNPFISATGKGKESPASLYALRSNAHEQGEYVRQPWWEDCMTATESTPVHSHVPRMNAD